MPLHGRHWHYRRPLNWWIGILFALGASLFALGGVLVLFPVLAAALGATWFTVIGAVAFGLGGLLLLPGLTVAR